MMRLSCRPHPNVCASRSYATCGDDGTVRLWERGTRELVAVTDLGGPARAAAFSPDGSALAVGMGASGGKYQDDDQAGGFRVLDGRTLEVVFEGQDASGWIHDIKCVACVSRAVVPRTPGGPGVVARLLTRVVSVCWPQVLA